MGHGIRPCANMCGFQATWHPKYCCKACAHWTGAHGQKCEMKPVPGMGAPDSSEIVLTDAAKRIAEDRKKSLAAKSLELLALAAPEEGKSESDLSDADSE